MDLSVDFLGQYPVQTRATYGQVLRDFQSRIDLDPTDAQQVHIAAYQRAIEEQASATVHKKLAALNSFYAYLIVRGYRVDNPMAGVRMPKVDSLRSVEYLTVDQIRDVMGSFEDTRKDRRDRAIIAVLLHGLRLAELTNVNIEDYKEGNLKVTGKGDKVRYVPISPTAQDYLTEYIGPRQNGPMFLSMYRLGGRIERRAIQKMVKQRTGLHPHALRHTCGTVMYRQTKNLAAVQELLGHASPVTTRVYTHLDLTDLREAVEASALLGEERTQLALVREA